MNDIMNGNKIKRCFTCRSRGDLGDCKDPFIHNASSVDNIRGIEVPPCASGWCAKIVEGSGSDYAVATERMCLQRPPRDEQQRCAPTLFLGRRVLMCFCRGDLCNTSFISKAHLFTEIFSVVFSLLLYNKWL
ncbi:UPAR/Ly6 domain-containing protein rtv [Parasteatoda tepidariorum]|uniref:UPAR/Ly6 domain-containing protein rtv n=1 Tax=Parasteatoda tepidariorum TaxID=114398 RepID=UPI0039BC251F